MECFQTASKYPVEALQAASEWAAGAFDTITYGEQYKRIQYYRKKNFDWHYDAGIVTADFMRVYSIDLTSKSHSFTGIPSSIYTWHSLPRQTRLRVKLWLQEVRLKEIPQRKKSVLMLGVLKLGRYLQQKMNYERWHSVTSNF